MVKFPSPFLVRFAELYLNSGLPRAASWAHKGPTGTPHTTTTHVSATMMPRQTRRGGGTRHSRNIPPALTGDSRLSSARIHDRKGGSATTTSTKTPSQTSSSRPPTPASVSLPLRPTTPADLKVLRQKKEPPPLPLPRSPTPSITVGSDLGSGSQDVALASPAIRPQSTDSIQSSAPSLPPGIPTVPPGLSAPPGIPMPTRPPRVGAASPQTPLLASQSSYQMSTAARALLDDVKARRESLLPPTAFSPFPDFDRTLQTLSGEDGEFGGFSFNLDPKLAGDDADNVQSLPEFEVDPGTAPFRGSYIDAFPALRSPGPSPVTFMPPPGLSYPHNPTRSIYDPLAARVSPIAPVEGQSTGSSNYTGSFNPFADHGEEPASSPARREYPLDDDRKVSRFGFARGRRGSTAASSPLHAASPLTNNDSHPSIYNSGDMLQTPSQQPQWTGSTRLQHSEYGYPQTGSAMGSPLAQQAQAQTVYAQQPSRFQPFDNPGVSEAQLRDLIQSSRDQTQSDRNRVGPTINGIPGRSLLYV
jgi:CCR4-NOT transcription complex subunit 4